jgi:hypothetical protein
VKDAPDGLQALITLFETDAFGSDRSARRRLEFILEQTNWPSQDLNLGIHFANAFSNCGIPDEFNDSDLYRAHGYIEESKRGQMNHFLTAVRFGYDTSFVSRAFRLGLGIPQDEPVEVVVIKLIVGHEIVADDQHPGFGSTVGTAGAQYQAATIYDVNSFNLALRQDAIGDTYAAHGRFGEAQTYFKVRDQYLAPILGDGYQDPAAPTNYRKGNSIQDLRLSVKGYRFGQDIRYNRITDRTHAASWLRRNLYPH